jgi:hypothetical protein
MASLKRNPEPKMKKITTTAQVTDTNGCDAGMQTVTLEIYADIVLSTLTVGGIQYHATGKGGESNGNTRTSAPAGTVMFECEGAGARRAWVDLAGAYVHLD